MKYIILIILMGFLLPAKSQDIFTGKLDNGLVYYLVKNDSKKIDFRLILNMGAAWEEHSESGYVHFIEHMSFHGSKNFPKGTGKFIKNHHITNNASTYKDKVIYSLDQVDPEKTSVDSCIYVLHDWGRFLNFDLQDVEKEKKVVSEEKRSDQRLTKSREEMAGLLYNHTKLAMVSCLGDMNVVGTATPNSLKSFYDKWFVPGLQAVYIEGDIDIQEYKKKLEACYADVKSCEPVIKENVVIPDNNSPYLKLFQGNGKYAKFELAFRLNDYPYSDKFDFLKKLVYTRLYTRVLEERTANFNYQRGNVLLDFQTECKGLSAGYSLFTLNFAAVKEQETECFNQVISHCNHLNEYGLTEQEKVIFLKNLWTLLGLDKRYGAYQVVEDNFLRGNPLYVLEDLKKVVQEVSQNYRNEDFTTFCRDYITFKNSLTVASVNDRSLEKSITLGLSGKDFSDVAIIPSKQVVFTDDLKEHKMVSETSISDRISHLKLDNGVEIYYVETDRDSTVVRGFSPGGVSVYAKGDIPLGQSIAGMMNLSKVNGYNPVAIDFYKRAKGITCHFTTDEYFNRVMATSGKEGIHDLYLFLYHRMMNSHCEEEEFAYYKAQELYRHMNTPPNTIKEEIARLTYGVNPRQPIFTTSYFDNFGIEDVKQEFKKVYGSRWCYVIESPISVKEFTNQYAKYFSNMPSSGEKSGYVVYKKFQLKKDFCKILSGMGSGLDLRIYLNKELSTREVMALHVLQYVIKNRCLVEFRDKKSALYGMYTDIQHAWSPENLHALNINFGTAPEHVSPFTDFIGKQLELVSRKEISQEEFDAAKIDFSKKEYTAIKAQCILHSFEQHYIEERDIFGETGKVDGLESVSTEDVLDIAKLFFKKGKKIEYLSK